MLEPTLSPILLPLEQDSYTITEMMEVVEHSYGFTIAGKQSQAVRRKIQREIKTQHPEKMPRNNRYPKDYVYQLLDEKLRKYFCKEKIKYAKHKNDPELMKQSEEELRIWENLDKYADDDTEKFAEFYEGYTPGEPVPGIDEIKSEIERRKREAVITYLTESGLDKLIDFDSDKLEADLRHQPDSDDPHPDPKQISAVRRLADIHNYYKEKQNLRTFLRKYLK